MQSFFFFNDTATTEIYTLSLHDALPICTNFNTTSGVVGPTIATSADGWTAWVKHTTTTKTCAIYVGSTSLAPASKERETTRIYLTHLTNAWTVLCCEKYAAALLFSPILR